MTQLALQLVDLLAYMKTFLVEISPELQFLIDLVDTKLVSRSEHVFHGTTFLLAG
jgi:hypothetical protein